MVAVGEDGGREELAGTGKTRAARDDPRTLGDGVGDVLLGDRDLAVDDHRADVDDLGSGRVALPEGEGELANALEERVVDRGMRIHPLDRDADLSRR